MSWSINGSETLVGTVHRHIHWLQCSYTSFKNETTYAGRPVMPVGRWQRGWAFMVMSLFTPGPIRALELSLPGLLAPWPIRSLALSLPGLLPTGNESSMKLAPLMCIAVYFRCLTLAFMPITQCKVHLGLIGKSAVDFLVVLIRDGPNVRLWHSAEAEGLGRLTERVPNVRPNVLH